MSGGDQTVFASTPEAIEAWLGRAKTGERFLYARCESFKLDKGLRAFVAQLHDDGEVVPVQRRAGALTEYCIDRRAAASRPRLKLGEPAAEPPAQPVPIETLGEEAGRLMLVLKWLAATKQACPSNETLADLADLRDRHAAAYQLTRLRDAGHVSVAPCRSGCPRTDVRVITIRATGRSTLRPMTARAT
jgi:hypothetical protein